MTEIPRDSLTCCNKTATMSSIQYVYPPGRAVDGMTNTSGCENTYQPNYQTCAISLIDNNPWWAVDLGNRYFISTVVITSGAFEGKANVSSVADEHVSRSNDSVLIEITNMMFCRWIIIIKTLV